MFVLLNQRTDLVSVKNVDKQKKIESLCRKFLYANEQKFGTQFALIKCISKF